MINGATITFAAIVSIVGLILMGLGHVIRSQGLSTLVAGYDPSKVRDPRGLTNWVGGHAIAVGGMTCIYGLAPLAIPEQLSLPYHLAFLGFMLVTISRMVIGARRF